MVEVMFMYRMKEFSKISNLSVKTLLYYDEEGILQPSYRNRENHFRYYNQEVSIPLSHIHSVNIAQCANKQAKKDKFRKKNRRIS